MNLRERKENRENCSPTVMIIAWNGRARDSSSVQVEERGRESERKAEWKARGYSIEWP